MGSRGPVPNRDADLARPRARKGGEQVEITNGVMQPYDIPEADPAWHPIAEMLWNSLWVSGQADFYQQSDVAIAYSLCDDLSFYKRNEYKRSGQMLQTIYSAMERLLVTEGDRRRVRLELVNSADPEEEASVSVMADYRAGLELVPDPT